MVLPWLAAVQQQVGAKSFVFFDQREAVASTAENLKGFFLTASFCIKHHTVARKEKLMVQIHLWKLAAVKERESAKQWAGFLGESNKQFCLILLPFLSCYVKCCPFLAGHKPAVPSTLQLESTNRKSSYSSFPLQQCVWAPLRCALQKILQRLVTHLECWLGSAKRALWVAFLLCLSFGIAWEFLFLGHLSWQTKAWWCFTWELNDTSRDPGYAVTYSLSVIFHLWCCWRGSCSWLLEERKNWEEFTIINVAHIWRDGWGVSLGSKHKISIFGNISLQRVVWHHSAVSFFIWAHTTPPSRWWNAVPLLNHAYYLGFRMIAVL